MTVESCMVDDDETYDCKNEISSIPIISRNIEQGSASNQESSNEIDLEDQNIILTDEQYDLIYFYLL